MRILIAAVALAIAAFATSANADGTPWWMCPPWMGCPQFRPLGVPGQVNSAYPVGVPRPVGTPFYVGRSHGFIGGRRVIVQERTRVIVRENWHIRCNNRTGECRRIR